MHPAALASARSNTSASRRTGARSSERRGRRGQVSQHSREKMLIRANHTFPQGMISMTDFVDALVRGCTSGLGASSGRVSNAHHHAIHYVNW